MRALSFAVLAALSLVLLLSRAAVADDAERSATAEALYDAGRRLLQDGKTAAACAQLQASQDVEPGIGALLLLAHCYEKLGKTASAWALFRQAESLALARGQRGRAEIARVRALALEAELPTLVIALPAAADASTWTVRRDALVIPSALWGVSAPVDPGEHTLEVGAPGHETWRTRVTVPEGPRTTRIEVPVLERSVSPRRAVAGLQEPPPAPSRPARSELAATSPKDIDPPQSSQRTWGYVTAGIGVAGVAVGVVTGLLAKSAYDQSDQHCRTSTLCDERGLELRQTAESRAAAATIATAAGAALAVGGLALLLTAPVEPTRAGSGAGIHLHGTW